MKMVVIYGDKKEKSIDETIIRALKNYNGVCYQSENNIHCFSHCYASPFFVYSSSKIPKIQGCSGIFVFKNSFCNFDEKEMPRNFTPIFDAQNTKAAKILKSTEQIAITCGVSQKSTLSISSFDGKQAIVSLQRYVKSIDLKTIEPGDFCVKLNCLTDVYPMLVASAILLLSGIDPKNGYNF
ncbi:MAG: hypothetical protein RUMPE_00255 [Eubacteriales bacterium SKADARSKE-1]|nr:hypothetical protein [Eubacteriales bacterium SKADARSKE-1]